MTVTSHHSATAERVLLTDSREGRAAHTQAVGKWLSETWDWDIFVTLTYDLNQERGKFRPGSRTHDVVGWGLSNYHWDQWLDETMNDVARTSTDPLNPPYWFRGREPNPNNRGTHFHALIGGLPRGFRRDVAYQRWFDRHGFARILPYDSKKGAGYYVAKYVAKDLGDLVFSPNMGLHAKENFDGSREHAARIHPAGWSGPDGSVSEREGAGGARPPRWREVSGPLRGHRPSW